MIGTYNKSSRNNSCTSYSRDSSSNDQSNRARRRSAYNRSNLKYEQCSEKDPFYWKLCIKFAKEELKAAIGQEVCRAVPAHFVEGVEVAGDFGNSSGDNGTILRIWYK